MVVERGDLVHSDVDLAERFADGGQSLQRRRAATVDAGLRRLRWRLDLYAAVEQRCDHLGTAALKQLDHLAYELDVLTRQRSMRCHPRREWWNGSGGLVGNHHGGARGCFRGEDYGATGSSYDHYVIDVRDAVQAAVRHVPGAEGLSIIQRSADHVVIDAGSAIVKCGTRDEFGIEAWACDRALSLGVPAPHIIAVDTSATIPYLALGKVAGVALSDRRLPLDVAACGARQAGAMLRRLHEVRLPGFGWVDREHFRRTAEVRGKSASWMEEISAELDPALDELVSWGALTAAQAARLRDEMKTALPSLEALSEGRFLHGDLARMHTFVDPQDGALTGIVDWGDVQIGDPAWDLAIAACHLASPSEGIMRVHVTPQRDLFPELLEGYRPATDLAQRWRALGSFYLAYRRAWVARLGPGEEGVPNPSLDALRRTLGSTR